MSSEAQPLLAVENLTKHFPIMQGVFRRQVGTVKAVDGLDFDIRERETLGLVGRAAAASRRWAASSCACTPLPRAASCFAERTSPRSRARRCGECARACR